MTDDTEEEALEDRVASLQSDSPTVAPTTNSNSSTEISTIKISKPIVRLHTKEIGRTNVFIDTGSSITLVKSKYINVEELKPYKGIIKTANNSQLKTLGSCNLTLMFPVGPKFKTCKLRVVVVDEANFPGHVLFGTDVLSKINAKLNFENNLLNINLDNTELELKLINKTILKSECIHHVKEENMTGDLIPIILKKKVKIKPNCMQLLKGQIDVPNKSIVNVLKGSQPVGCPIIADSVNEVNNKNIVLAVYSSSKKEYTIPGGTRVAFATLLENEHELVNTMSTLLPTELITIEDNNFPPIMENDVPPTPILSPPDRSRLLKLLNKRRKAIALAQEPLGRTDVIEHAIRLKNNAPIYAKPFPIAHSQIAGLKKSINEMKEKNVIETSKSPWNFPIILVKKKDGSLRPCIDFRRLNLETIPDPFPIPRIDEILKDLNGNSYFTNLDLESAFWQVPLREEDKEKTAFTDGSQRYQFCVMPFGAMNSPATFQRLMNSVLIGILGEGALVYLDDLLLYSNNINDHFKLLDQVLDRLVKAGLKIKLSKCNFFKNKIDYLGHTISGEGVRISESHIIQIKNYVEPTNLKELRSYLGLISYFRKFLPRLSDVVKPLQQLIKNDVPFVWGKAQQLAFNQSKEILTKTITLKFPKYTQPFYLSVDASSHALGAVLLQEHENFLCPVSFASKTLNETERRYSTTKREALAVVWGLKKFRYLILGYDVTILTDHLPLVSLFRKNVPSGTLGRWAVIAQEFQPRLKYIKGKSNILADCMSRLPIAHVENAPEAIDPEEFPEHVASLDIDITPAFTSPAWSVEEMVQAQEGDSDINKIKLYLQSLRNSDGTSHKTPRFYEKEGLNAPYYFLEKDLVWRAVLKDNDEWYFQLMIPSKMINKAISICHDGLLAGHTGIDRTLELCQRNFFFPHPKDAIKAFIDKCQICAKCKARAPPKIPLSKYPMPSFPFHTISFDLLSSLPVTTLGNKYILVVTDFLTRFILAFPLKTRTSAVVAETLFNGVFLPYSVPHVVLSDNAAEYTSALFKRFCELLKTKHARIAVYRPQANGLTERANSKILTILRIFCNLCPSNRWDEMIPAATAVINNSLNVTIGNSPHFALFHFQKRLFPQLPSCNGDRPKEEMIPLEKIIQSHHRALSYVRDNIETNTEKYIKHYRCGKMRMLPIGSMAYYKYIPKPGENYKLAPRFTGPAKVVSLARPNVYNLEHNDKIIQAHIDNIYSREAKPVSNPVETPSSGKPLSSVDLEVTPLELPPSSNTEMVLPPPLPTKRRYQKRIFPPRESPVVTRSKAKDMEKLEEGQENMMVEPEKIKSLDENVDHEAQNIEPQKKLFNI